jgi:RNA polymerase sigma-70 factor (ECF subfamily)
VNEAKQTDPMQNNAELNEKKWLRQARNGDDDSFARIVTHYQGPVYNLCYRMLGDAAAAEDAAQETFLRAYRNLGRYDPGRKFINWLLTIASNYCVDRLRKRRLKFVSLESILPGESLMDKQASPEEQFANAEMQENIQGLLNQLSPNDRAAVVLKYWYDMSYDEIAATLSLSISAVKSRLHRARRELANLWGVRPTVGYRRHDEASAL